MSNRYARYSAIARTCPQRLFSGGLTAMWVVILPVMVVVPFLAQYDLRRTSLPVTLLMPGAFLIGILAIHLKQLAIDAKSRLLPRSMRAVPLVSGGCAAVYLIGLPLLMNLRGGVPLLWSAALIWVWCAAVFHFVIRQSWPAMVVLAAVYGLSLMQPSPLTTWLTDTRYPLVACPLVLASIVWIAIVTRWLLQMNEESRGYTALSSRQLAWRARNVSTEEANRPWQNPHGSWWLRFASPGQRRMDRLVGCSGSASIFRRCRRWQVDGMQQYLPFVFILFSFTVARGWGAGSHSAPSPVPIMLVLIAIMKPGVQRVQQWRMITNDLLKPIRREDYLCEMGLCLAIDMARNLAIVFVVILSFTLVLSPGDLRPDVVLAWLLVTGLSAIFCFGVVVWMLRYRSFPAAFAPNLVIAVPCGMVAAGWRDPAMYWYAFYVAAILALIGLWLTRNAYRRWLLTDLG